MISPLCIKGCGATIWGYTNREIGLAVVRTPLTLVTNEDRMVESEAFSNDVEDAGGVSDEDEAGVDVVEESGWGDEDIDEELTRGEDDGDEDVEMVSEVGVVEGVEVDEEGA